MSVVEPERAIVRCSEKRCSAGFAHARRADSSVVRSARIPAGCRAQRRLPFQLLTYFDLANGILPSRVHVFSEEISGLALKFGLPSASYT